MSIEPHHQSVRCAGAGAIAIAAIAAVIVGSVGCASTHRSMTVDEKRAYLLELEEKTLAELVEEHPEAAADLETAVGYAIFSNTATKVPLVGAGNGIGVVVNTGTGKRTYLEVKRFDVGGGLGSRKYRLIMIYFDEAAFGKLASGSLELVAGVDAGAGKKDVGSGSGAIAPARNEKRAMYQMAEAGVSATYTVRLIKYSVLDLGD